MYCSAPVSATTTVPIFKLYINYVYTWYISTTTVEYTNYTRYIPVCDGETRCRQLTAVRDSVVMRLLVAVAALKTITTRWRSVLSVDYR